MSKENELRELLLRYSILLSQKQYLENECERNLKRLISLHILDEVPKDRGSLMSMLREKLKGLSDK